VRSTIDLARHGLRSTAEGIEKRGRATMADDGGMRPRTRLPHRHTHARRSGTDGSPTRRSVSHPSPATCRRRKSTD
jgi:hypothetical protein